MRRSHLRLPRAAATALALLTFLSCSDSSTDPRGLTAPGAASRTLLPGAPAILISQIYGGGGNSGSTYTNDFVELFNPGSEPVSVNGWSIQYASAAGTSWAVTAISGTIPAGGYYLVQESQGTGGSTPLPTPDATGTITMSATAGKVALASSTTALMGACPSGGSAVEVVSFGNGNCGDPTATLSNPVAALRLEGGCQWTGSPTTDFTTVNPPTPRNSLSPAHPCGVTPTEPVALSIAPDSTNITVGATATFTATAKDADSNVVAATVTWSSSDTTVATVGPTGIATGLAQGVVTITASASGLSATARLSVSSSGGGDENVGDVVISQVYGGGGNSGATLKNDFIELFNRSSHDIDLTGWSVQYASAAGNFTQATPLSGTILAGHYFLVQEAAGNGGTVDLPTPDVSGGIAMGAGSGKVLLSRTAAAAGVACPAGATVADQVSYGTGTNCGTTTAVLDATHAALRKNGGCFFSGSASADFEVATPAPRNSSSPTRSCVVGPFDHVTISGSLTIPAGSSSQLTANALDASENLVPGATVAWSSSDPAVATASPTGLVAGLTPSVETVVITATVTVNGVVKSASVNVQVTDPNGINWIDISSSSTSLPPGFQTQLFATARVAQNGTIVDADFTFEAVDPQYATVANVPSTGGTNPGQMTGIVTGVAAPSDGSRPGIRITATPKNGGLPYTFISHPVTIEAPAPAPTSIYGSNDEFGDPTAASSSSPTDLLIRRPQYVISYNESRGTPNWVSYELDERQMATGQDRCNCFTADPLLPADKQIFTSDYTNGGYDRGHMARSADRTAGNVDNAITFYLTNIVPQQADLNQGVWANFENALADSARAGRAVYVITGPLYSQGHPLTFIKNEGKVAIPDSTWKIALIGPGNGGNPFTRANVQSFADLTGLTLLAVNMPNVAGVRNNPWSMYLTTVEKIEASTGYDFFTLMKTGFEPALDHKDRAPTASFLTTGDAIRGRPLTFDASASSDPDVGRTDLGRTESLAYTWHFSDGGSASGAVVAHTFMNTGTFTATLTVTDAFGWPDSTSSSLTIAPPPVPVAALIRHVPTLNGTVDGSLQLMSGENVTLNGNARITESLFVPGTPNVHLNGKPVIGPTVDGGGSALPGGYTLTLNGGSSISTLVRRTDPLTLPVVSEPAAPTGTRDVILDKSSDTVGSWSTVRNLTLNGGVGSLRVPGGAYGDIVVNGNNSLVLGTAGATTPSVYQFQHLRLNGSASVQVVGPVIVVVADAVTLNGSMGASGNANWLTLAIAQGGLTLNGSVSVSGTVLAPNGTVTVNGGTSLTGALAADRLVINGNGAVKITSAVPIP